MEDKLMEQQGKKTRLDEVRQHIGQYQVQLNGCRLTSMRSGLSRQGYDELVAMYLLLSSMQQTLMQDLTAIKRSLAGRGSTNVPVGGSGGEVVLETLTSRELDVLQLFGKGYSYNETAALLGCQLATVQTHAKHIYAKLGVHSRSEAVFEASLMGLIGLLD